ncbi:6-O-methylguanine DNA methyltransferase [Boeremia exigua]|uniref:6-O-methylguanine DNA methyltransferase n=1 Tax=Boeremia exigua TaxID=749465 RepID=UPI001E8CBE7C|nr:6-O-methylguanine DNA methyltransferase [Boeremia exigua]KAH6616361.1 6-O-methylguanine DNA methyltransferase [Boeremia exigua]
MAPGARSEEAWLWHTAVCEAIQEIPSGRVTTYAHIARLVGKPQCPRQVGVCLKHLPPPSTDPEKESPAFHSGNVPWQRVINSKGGISPRGPGAASRQADALRAEGVEVDEDSMNIYTVNLKDYGWFPDILPSETGLLESSDEDDEETAAYHT